MQLVHIYLIAPDKISIFKCRQFTIKLGLANLFILEFLNQICPTGQCGSVVEKTQQ